jgi:hypothetical protein
MNEEQFIVHISKSAFKWNYYYGMDISMEISTEKCLEELTRID